MEEKQKAAAKRSLGLGPPGLEWLFSREVEELREMNFTTRCRGEKYGVPDLLKDLEVFRKMVDRSFINEFNDLEDMDDLVEMISDFCRNVIQAKESAKGVEKWKFDAEHISDALLARKYALTKMKARGRTACDDDSWQLPEFRRKFRKDTQKFKKMLEEREKGLCDILGAILVKKRAQSN